MHLPRLYRVCCRQAGNRLTISSGSDKQLLVKLRGFVESVPNVAAISMATLSTSSGCQLLCWLHLRTSARQHDSVSIPRSCTSLLCPIQPKSSAIAADECTVPGDTACLSATSRLQARHGSHAANKHVDHRSPFSQQVAEYEAECTNPTQNGDAFEKVLALSGMTLAQLSCLQTNQRAEFYGLV